MRWPKERSGLGEMPMCWSIRTGWAAIRTCSKCTDGVLVAEESYFNVAKPQRPAADPRVDRRWFRIAAWRATKLSSGQSLGRQRWSGCCGVARWTRDGLQAGAISSSHTGDLRASLGGRESRLTPAKLSWRLAPRLHINMAYENVQSRN